MTVPLRSNGTDTSSTPLLLLRRIQSCRVKPRVWIGRQSGGASPRPCRLLSLRGAVRESGQSHGSDRVGEGWKGEADLRFSRSAKQENVYELNVMETDEKVRR